MNWTVNFIAPPAAVVLPPARDTVVCIDVDIANVCIPFTYDSQNVSAIGVSLLNSSVVHTLNYSNGNGQFCFSPI